MDDVERALRSIDRGTAAGKLESARLDFKQPGSTSKATMTDLAEAAVCFANATGGSVVVGVRDSPGGPEAYVGTDLSPEVVRRRMYELTEPGLDTVVAVLQHGGARLLSITVLEGLEVYATKKGYAYKRRGTDCTPMGPADITRLSEERRSVDWSSAASDRDVADVDAVALRRLRALLAQSGNESGVALSRREDGDVLAALSLVSHDGRLNRAGELFLCAPVSTEPAPRIVYQHRRTRGGEATASLRWGTPLLTAIEGVMAAVSARQDITPVTLRTGLQLQIENYPAVAVREALVNAVAHGDPRYQRPVHLEHSPDALTISSPGPLVAGITVDNILTLGSRPRFASMLPILRETRLAEALGQGVDRMFRTMIANGRDVPRIEDLGDEVVVTFLGGAVNKRVASFVHSLPQEEQDDTDALLLLHVLCQRPSVTARDVSGVLQRPVDDAQRVLHRLSVGVAQLVEPTASTSARALPNYRLRHDVVVALGPAIGYRRRDKAEVDVKVAEHVREYGYINNSTVQRLFDVDVYQARDILRDLVGRELLVRTSQQSRGTAVRYGQGPRFPALRRARR